MLSLSYANTSATTQDVVRSNENISSNILGLASNASNIGVRIGYFKHDSSY